MVTIDSLKQAVDKEISVFLNHGMIHDTSIKIRGEESIINIINTTKKEDRKHFKFIINIVDGIAEYKPLNLFSLLRMQAVPIVYKKVEGKKTYQVPDNVKYWGGTIFCYNSQSKESLIIFKKEDNTKAIDQTMLTPKELYTKSDFL